MTLIAGRFNRKGDALDDSVCRYAEISKGEFSLSLS